MQGFQPAARRLAQLPEHPQHLADGGSVGFGSRGLAGLRDMVPKMAAMGYPQAAAPAPAQAPAAGPSGADRLRAMIPQVEAMGYKQAAAPQPQYFAGGGVVRGPGTGTSDSIEAEAEPGTFIMPADSTQAIGPSALEQLGTVPVRLSDGEFQMPPEQVMAIGEAVLKLMKDATHAPVNGVDGGQTDAELAEPAGFAPDAAQRMAAPPEQRFADGGLVDPNTPKLGAPVGMPSPATSAMATPPAQATAAPMGWQARNDRRNVEVTASSIMDSPERRAAQAALAAAPTPLAAPAPVGMPASPTAPAPAPLAGGFQSASQRLASPLLGQPSLASQPLSQRPRGFADGGLVEPVGYYDGGLVGEEEKRRLAQIPTGGPAGWTGGGGAPAPSPAAQALSARVDQIPAGGPAVWTGGGGGGSTGAPAPAPAPLPPAASSGPLSRAAGMSPPTPAPEPTPATSPAAQALSAAPAGMVTREGNSYTGPANITGDVSVNGEAPRNGGAISGQNMAAADSLAGRASQESAARVLGQMPAAPAGFQAPVVRNSTNDWALRKEIDNARTAASSITNTRRWGGRGAENNTDAMELQSLLRADGVSRGAQPVLDQAAMQEAGASRRAATADAGADRRALIGERGLNSRALIGERGQNQRATIAADAALGAAKVKADGKSPEMSTTLRKEYEGLPEVKNYKQALPAYKGIEDAVKRNTPMSDINIVYGIAKLYDPNSVVREGEYATVANAPGIPERVKGWVQYAQGGGKLTPEVKKQIMEEATSRMTGFQNEFEGVNTRYSDIANRSGADASLVTPTNYQPAVQKQALPPQVAELQRRAAGNPALAARLKEAGY